MPIPVISSLITAYPWLGPYLKEIGLRGAVALGGYGLGKLMGSPEQTAYQQQLAQIQRLQPEYLNLLQKQMRGEPTAASEAIRRQVAQEGRAAGQSLATSAARMGQGGTAVARAQQGRLAEAEMQALSSRLGEAQMQAQAQVGGLVGGTQQQQALLAQQEASDLSELTRYLVAGIGDVALKQLIQEYINAISGATTQPLMQTAPATFMPEVSYEPMSQWYGRMMREQLAGLPRSTSATPQAAPTIVPATPPAVPTTTQPLMQGWQPTMTPSMERRQFGPLPGLPRSTSATPPTATPTLGPPAPTIVPTVPQVSRTSPDVEWLSQQTGFAPQLIAESIENEGNIFDALYHLYTKSTPEAAPIDIIIDINEILNRYRRWQVDEPKRRKEMMGEKTYTPGSASATQTWRGVKRGIRDEAAGGGLPDYGW